MTVGVSGMFAIVSIILFSNLQSLRNPSEDDDTFLQNLYQRIMDGSDPLAMSEMYDQSLEMYFI